MESYLLSTFCAALGLLRTNRIHDSEAGSRLGYRAPSTPELADTTIQKVIRPFLPSFIAMLVALILTTYVPALSLWLPQKFGF